MSSSYCSLKSGNFLEKKKKLVIFYSSISQTGVNERKHCSSTWSSENPLWQCS